MRILLIAPQPFFSERGTPIATDLLLDSLSRRGDEVDVVTFHLGEERRYPGVRISRIAPRPTPSYVKPGFSMPKIYCDFFLAVRAASMARRRRYDLIYGIEEGGMIAMLLSAISGVPFVYDMDSSMAAQLVERYPFLRPVAPVLDRLEALPMKRAAAVVPMCEELAKTAREHCRGRVHVLTDVSLIGREVTEAEDLRATHHLDSALLLYVGNLEPHQGIDLLLESFAKLRADADLVVIGGCDASIERCRALALELGIDARTHFVGPRPVAALGRYLQQADILLSPRTEGTNTPLKLYSYLDSGVPVVATDMPTHTQVVSEREAALAPPEPRQMAAAIDRLLASPAESRALCDNARRLVRRRHSPERFHEQVMALFSSLEADLAIDATSARRLQQARRARYLYDSATAGERR